MLGRSRGPRTFGSSVTMEVNPISSGNAASIQFLILAESGGVTCSGGSVNRGDIPLTATAWIDVSGAGAATCSDLHNPQCQPSPSDSQAHQSAVLRFGQLTQIRLDVVDQP